MVRTPFWRCETLIHFATAVHFLPFHSFLSCCELSVLSGTVFLEVDDISVCCLCGKFLLMTAHSNTTPYTVPSLSLPYLRLRFVD